MFSDPKDDNFCVSFAINFYLRCPVGLRSAAKDCAAEHFAAPGLGKMRFFIREIREDVAGHIRDPTIRNHPIWEVCFSILNEYHPMMEKSG